jgi:hypothetical protein
MAKFKKHPNPNSKWHWLHVVLGTITAVLSPIVFFIDRAVASVFLPHIHLPNIQTYFKQKQHIVMATVRLLLYVAALLIFWLFYWLYSVRIMRFV